MGAGVEGEFVIDDEHVAMVAMGQRDLNAPVAVEAAAHGGGLQGPVVEIASDENRFGFGRVTIEIDRLDGLFGGEAAETTPALSLI